MVPDEPGVVGQDQMVAIWIRLGRPDSDGSHVSPVVVTRVRWSPSESGCGGQVQIVAIRTRLTDQNQMVVAWARLCRPDVDGSHLSQVLGDAVQIDGSRPSPGVETKIRW